VSRDRKHKRRINKRKLRELRARDALERLVHELQRSSVPAEIVKKAAEAFAIIIESKERKIR
jgi:hypothetical protein